MSRQDQTRVAAGWTVAVAGPLLAAGVLTGLDDAADYRPAWWFLVVAVIAAWLAGRRALVVCVALSAAAFAITVIGPVLEDDVSIAPEVASLTLFVVVGLLIGLLVDRLQRALAAERAAAASSAMAAALEQAQRIAHVGSWEWDRSTNTVTRSAEMCSILGLDPVEHAVVPASALFDQVHPDDRKRVRALAEKRVGSGDPFEDEQRIIRPDGAVRQLLVRGEPIFGEGGRVVGVRGVSQDVTEQREAEAALRDTRLELYRSELDRLQERQRVEALQEAVLPTEMPQLPWLAIDACYTPATPELTIGGDWYDVFTLDECTVAFTVGDVSGHGVEAAALMAQLRNALRAYVIEDPAPASVVGRLNRLLCHLRVDAFATAIFGLATPERVIWACAGHPSPVAFGAGPARVVEAASGGLLGINPANAYEDVSLELGPGEGLLLYTDGLIERRGEHIDVGAKRLLEAVDELGVQERPGLCRQLVERLVPEQSRDDVCQVVLRRPRGSGP